MVINGVIWRTRSGSLWRELPEVYGNWKTVSNRHRRWSGYRTWERILDELRRGTDLDKGAAWAVRVDADVVRAHQHTGARYLPPTTCPLSTSTRRSSPSPRWAQGARPNDMKAGDEPRQEALGWSRGGLTTKIHLAADTRCRSISRVTTAGHRRDCLAFESVMASIRIRRRARIRPARVLGDKVYSTERSAPTCGDARSGPPSPSRPANKPTVRVAQAKADGHRSFD
jgi:transposase